MEVEGSSHPRTFSKEVCHPELLKRTERGIEKNRKGD